MASGETTAVNEPQAKENKPMSQQMRMIALFLVFFLLIIIVIFSGNVKASRQIASERRDTAAALSKALVAEVLQGDEKRLRMTIETIAKEANYASISITDTDGLVLATTDRTTAGEVRDDMKKLGLEAISVKVNGLKAVRKAIVLGENNVQGSLEIVFKD